jgi:hypothetical protein
LASGYVQDRGLPVPAREDDDPMSRRYHFPTYVVYDPKRGYLQERQKRVGFHWETTGRAWCRAARNATKFPRTIARILAVEHDALALPAEHDDQRHGTTQT